MTSVVALSMIQKNWRWSFVDNQGVNVAVQIQIDKLDLQRISVAQGLDGNRKTIAYNVVGQLFQKIERLCPKYKCPVQCYWR